MSVANPVLPDAASPRLTALPVEQAVALLRRSGGQRVSVESLRGDPAAGGLGQTALECVIPAPSAPTAV